MGGAFDHGSSGIRSIFRTPDSFLRMLETGYPTIWRPERFVGTLEWAHDD